MYRLIPKPKLSLYWRVMIGLGVVAVPLIIFDARQLSLVIYALSGI